jgi:hypothetical protein
VGNPTIQTGAHISCGFAENALIFAANYYQTNGELPDGVSTTIYSPDMGQSYDVLYAVSSDGSMITATNTDSADVNGSNEITFASYLAEGTG